jgi:Tol biopolymer transport system component
MGEAGRAARCRRGRLPERTARGAVVKGRSKRIAVLVLALSGLFPLPARPETDRPGGSGGDAPCIRALRQGVLRQLTTDRGNDVEPKWSPDGARLSFASDRTGTWNVWTVTRDGAAERQLTTTLQYVHSTWWSPDGKRLAIAASWKEGDGFIGHIYVLDVGGNAPPRRITEGPVDGAPCWSPDGASIAFVSNRSGNWDIWTVGLDGAEPLQRTTDEGFDHSPRWSPDGTRLAFHSARSGNGDIWVLTLDSGELRRLTTSPAFDHFPTWSPDGKWIAFHSDRDGDFDIWAVPADGGEPVRLTSGAGNDTRPAWSPDGRAIAFTSDRAGNPDVWLLTSE